MRGRSDGDGGAHDGGLHDGLGGILREAGPRSARQRAPQSRHLLAEGSNLEATATIGEAAASARRSAAAFAVLGTCRIRVPICHRTTQVAPLVGRERVRVVFLEDGSIAVLTCRWAHQGLAPAVPGR